MKGITNAPQGSGGSGGEWTERTASMDWTDIFDITGNMVTAKKDIMIYASRVQIGDLGYPIFATINAIIPKGVSISTSISIPFSVSYESTPAGRTFGGASLLISAARMQTNSYFNVFMSQYQPVLNDSTITYNVTNNANGTITKSLLKVFTKG